MWKDRHWDGVASAQIDNIVYEGVLIIVRSSFLLHLSKDDQSKEQFMQHIQGAVTFWDILILATGGFIKQSKSQVGLSCFRFVNGKPALKKKKELPSFQFTIPQKDGTDVSIPTVSVMEGTDSLGVKFDMENKCLHHVDKLNFKGSKWTSRLNSAVHISLYQSSRQLV